LVAFLVLYARVRNRGASYLSFALDRFRDEVFQGPRRVHAVEDADGHEGDDRESSEQGQKPGRSDTLLGLIRSGVEGRPRI